MTSWSLRVALCAMLVMVLGAAPASAQEPRFDVLVFSKTTGFRHTDAIEAGHDAIAQMGAAGNYNVVESEDDGLFTDAGLQPYEVVVFLNVDGEDILNGAQRNAFERWMQHGGGLVGIHGAANANRDWDWYGDMMGGAWFDSHPAGELQFQTASVNVDDAAHPSTADIDNDPWVREDEWYNFTEEPQDVHVLLSLDESTYEEQDGSPEADEHPIAWCSNYDGGRHFYTALGHKGTYWSEPDYLDHISGAIEWAAGAAPGDCGPEREGIPTDAAFDKVTLDDTTENPMEIAVGADGSVYYVELAGAVKRWDAASNQIDTIGTIPVHRGNENGLLGITLDPDFETNRWIYLFYSAPTPEVQHVSRFTLNEDDTIDMASEQVLLEIPHQRIICCHSSGSLTFGPDGNLFISTGDDTAHYASDGFNPIDDRFHGEVESDNPDAQHAFDARRSSGNTNDLRGKILRITPQDDGTYTIPPDNLFPPLTSDPLKTRPEIYSMGHRNPFRIQVDQETGWLYNGEVGPDAGSDEPDRGPRGYDELNQIRQASNMGWPYCIADNQAYNDFDFETGTSGPKFDCAGGPANDSAWNTGLSQTPPASPALLWWPYGESPDFPDIPTGPGRTAIAGPVYHFDPENPAETKLPAYYDDKVFFADWSRDWIATLTLDEQGMPAGIQEFMPGADFRHPQDMEMGADGSLYVLEWGRDFNYAGENVNPDSGLYRIDYAKGARTPVARATSDVDSGPVPLDVTFSSADSTDADGDELTFEWDFDDGSPVSTEPNPTHTFTEPGTYRVRLTATDSTGKSGSSTVVIEAGNTRPTVTLDVPVQGGFYDWGDEIPYEVTVTDPEDESIDCEQVAVNVGIFHDEGGNAHVHPGTNRAGCSGTFDAPATSGHAKSANIALVVTATYTDTGGDPGSSPLQGASTRRLNPKTIQAEHYTDHTGTQTNTVTEAEGGRTVGYADEGEWIYFEPVSLLNVDEVTIRYAAGFEGGMVDFRLGAPDGPVVGTATLPPTDGWQDFHDVTIPLDADPASGRLYLTFKGIPGQRTTDLFDLDELRFAGTGVASNSAPTAAAEADKTSGAIPLTVNFTGSGEDADGEPVTYEWDFESDGTVDATTPDASHTYTEAGSYTATFTVSDGARERSVEIEIDAYPPVESCPGDDEFGGTALDPKWTVVREDPERLSVQDGALHITSAKLDIHGGDSGMPNIVLQDLPDGVPWTATTRVTWNPNENYQNAGLLIYESDSAWIKSGMVWADGRAFEAFKELGDTPQGLGNGPAVPEDFPSTFYLRFVSEDGSSVQAQRSADGQEWVDTGSATNLDGLDDPRIGMYATASTSSGTGTPTAGFDFFKLTVPQEPTDEFDGDTLNTCRWSEIVRHDPNGYEVAGGELVLPAAHGDFFGDAPNDNPNIVLQPAPAGEWTATTRLTFSPDENYEQAGLIVYGDDANYVKADLVSSGGNRVLEFLRETDDAAAGFGGSVPLDAGFPDTVEIRVISDGTTLTAEYRAVDGQWEPFGEPAALADVPSPKIGVYANDGNQEVESREDAAFDFFHLEEGTPGEPPGDGVQVQAFADPRSGTAPLDVRLSATGLDPDGGRLTYRWELGDGGVSYARAPRHTYLEPGTYTATVTATDDEGDTGTASVEIEVSDPPGNGTPAVEAAADPASGTAPLRVRFSAQGTDPDGDRLTYAWEFGDGSGAIRRNATHRYMEPGTYAATVTVTDPGGASATADVEVVVSEPPGNGAPSVQAAADPAAGAAPLRVRFTSAGTDPDGDRLSYVWEFGDGGQAGGRRAVHTYTAPGDYTATVTVTDRHGATGTAEVDVTVTGAAQAAPPAGTGSSSGASRGAAPTGSSAAPAGSSAPKGPSGGAGSDGEVAGERAVGGLRVSSLARRQRVRRIVRRGLRYRVACETACKVSAVLRVSGRRLGRSSVRAVKAGRSRRIVVRLSRRVRRNLVAAMREADVRRVRATLVTKIRTGDDTRKVRRRVVLRR